MIFAYILTIFLLFYFKILSDKDLILTFTTAFGWLIALFIAIINLDRARKDNKEAKDYEIKKRLEIDAFKELNKAINVFSGKLINSSTFFLATLPNHLKNHLNNPTLFKYDPIARDLEKGALHASLYEGEAAFTLAIEANEIAVVDFDYLRKYIFIQMDKLHKMLFEFDTYSLKLLDTNYTKQPQAYQELKDGCDRIWLFINSILGYLFDYRIILMNSILSDIFDRSVPHRKPLDPRIKTLTEVASKEETEKELERISIAETK